MNFSIFEFLLIALATFRLTRLIVFDKITAFLRKPFLKEVEETESDGTIVTYIEIKGSGIRNWMGELLSCYWCTGIWSTIILFGLYYVWPDAMEIVIFLLAIAGSAGILEVIVNRFIDES